MMKNNNSEQQFKLVLTRFTHSLALSIYHCIKDRTYHEQMSIVEIFCNMYQRFPANFEMYQVARTLLIDEVDNHINGKATTFTDARKARHLNIENTNMDLMANVRKAIASKTEHNNSTFYNSFLIRSNTGPNIIVRTNTQIKLGNMRLDKICYRKACIQIHNYQIPLMYQPNMTDSRCVESFIQWIRILYSRTLDVSPTNPNIWYYLAVDALIMQINNQSNKTPELNHISEQYTAAVNMFLDENVFGTQIKLIDRFIQNQKVIIDYGVLINAQVYSNLNICTLSLFFLIINKFVCSRITDETKRNDFVKGLVTYCSKQICYDIGSDPVIEPAIDPAIEPATLDVNTLMQQICKKASKNKVIVFDIITEDINMITQHRMNGIDGINAINDIMCPERLINSKNKDEITTCNICSGPVVIKTIAKTPDDQIASLYSLLNDIRLNDGNFKPHIVNNNLFTNFNMMDGENEDMYLLSPDNFSTSDEYMLCKNVMIVDPISSSKMRIDTQEAFLKRVNDKYPFLNEICMDNVALAGGFVRSILCKQEMKDFDFFFHSLRTNDEYMETLNKTIVDLVNSVRRFYAKQHINVKFGKFYKPMFNVIELICFEDPTNHIDENFDLSNFHSYKFRSLKRYGGDVKRPENQNQVLNQILNENNKERNIDDDDNSNDDNNNDDNSDDKSDESSDRKRRHQRRNRPHKKHVGGNDKFYFEDGDDHGIKMRHRFQFILCKYDSKFNIIQSFDMFPSKVLFDGKRVHFTNKSLIAYQYMINEIMLDGGSTLFKHRVAKYFKYGFSMVFPPNDRKWKGENHSNKYNLKDAHYAGSDENKGPLSFKIRKIYDNVIIVSHNSNIEKMLERNETLEANAKEEGKGLYLSSLFCSFVSILRYVDINGINYMFPKIEQIKFPELQELKEDTLREITINDVTLDDMNIRSEGIQFKTGLVKVDFKECFSTLFKTRDWFKSFYESMLLTDYENHNKNNSDDDDSIDADADVDADVNADVDADVDVDVVVVDADVDDSVNVVDDDSVNADDDDDADTDDSVNVVVNNSNYIDDRPAELMALVNKLHGGKRPNF